MDDSMQVKKAKDAQNEYMRKWRAEHKDKVKQYNATYWQRVAERIAKEQNEGKQTKIKITLTDSPQDFYEGSPDAAELAETIIITDWDIVRIGTVVLKGIIDGYNVIATRGE